MTRFVKVDDSAWIAAEQVVGLRQHAAGNTTVLLSGGAYIVVEATATDIMAAINPPPPQPAGGRDVARTELAVEARRRAEQRATELDEALR